MGAHSQALLATHAGEAHALVWRGGRGAVLLREGIRGADLLRPLWQVRTGLEPQALFSTAHFCACE